MYERTLIYNQLNIFEHYRLETLFTTKSLIVYTIMRDLLWQFRI